MIAANQKSEALPKSARIRKRREYLQTYRTGRKSFGRYVVVFALPNEGLGTRLGITATRKVGKANVRNLRKRWTREVFRRNRAALTNGPVDLDLVVNLNRSAADADFASFSHDLLRTLKRALRGARNESETTE